MALDIKKIAEALAELPKDAGAEQIHKCVEAAILAQEAVEPPKEEKPEAPAEPVAEAAPLAAAPAEVPCSDAPAVAAADPVVAPPADAPALADAAVAGDAAASDALAALKAATGLDDAGVLAFLRDNADAIGALAGKAPDAGQVSDAPSKMSTELSAAQAALTARDAQIVALNAEVVSLRAVKEAADKAAAEEHAKTVRLTAEKRVEGLIACGKLLDAQRPMMVDLAVSSPDVFAKYVETAPQVVPLGVIAAAPAPAAALDTSDPLDPEQVDALMVNLSTIEPNADKRRALAESKLRAVKSRKSNGTVRLEATGR